MKTLRPLFSFFLLPLGLSLASAQDYVNDLQGQMDRAAGVYHSYEAAPDRDTPAPKGFKPFYISHYGRHGSRHQIGSAGTRAYQYMHAAQEAGILTEAGERLFRDVETIYNEHVGMDGELSIRGGREHVGIAQRMYQRFPAVFRDKKRNAIHAEASYIPRCILSMTNFTGSLKDEAPSLRFDYITGQKYIELLARDYYDRDSYRERQRAINDSLLRNYIDPRRIMDAFFVPGARRDEILPDPWDFVHYLACYAFDCQCLYYELDGLDLYPYFTQDEWLALGRYFNERTYSSFGNSLNFGDHVAWAPKWLVEEIIAKADAAIATGSETAADLRFGHDSGILPLAHLLALSGPRDADGRYATASAPSARYAVGEAWQHGYYIWQQVPMATNLQIVFYRNKKAEVLVKMLYNEKEVIVLPLQAAYEGPYIAWPRLRDYLVSISENKEFGK